jgi:hypothetical protein
MKHQTFDQLQGVAEVHPGYVLSRGERLERWAQLLERNPERRLSTLHQTEYQPDGARATMRADETAISVAFQDDVLRGAGMKDDTYGEAKRFFELTDAQLHEVICYCHFGASVSAATAARHIRAVAEGKQLGMFARVQEAFRR